MEKMPYRSDMDVAMSVVSTGDVVGSDWQNGLPVAIAILVFTSFGGWLGGQFFLKLAPKIMRNRRLVAQT